MLTAQSPKVTGAEGLAEKRIMISVLVDQYWGLHQLSEMESMFERVPVVKSYAGRNATTASMRRHEHLTGSGGTDVQDRVRRRADDRSVVRWELPQVGVQYTGLAEVRISDYLVVNPART